MRRPLKTQDQIDEAAGAVAAKKGQDDVHKARGQNPTGAEDPHGQWSFSVGLVSSACAPSWTLNPFILSGYRKQSTVRQAFASVLIRHNETGNIMTHLVGLLVFVGMMIRDLYFRNLPHPHRIIHGAMLLAAQFCMGSSTVYHVLLPISERTSEIALTCDLAGVAGCIVTIFAVGLQYAFWCHEDLGHMYLCMVGVLSAVLMVLPNVQAFQRLHKHAIPFLYFGFVVFALVPLVHWVILVGCPGSEQGQLWFFRILAAGISLAVGFFFWAARFPESKWPGRFDFFCQSHQIWHTFVFVSICCFYDAMTRYADFRIQHSCGGIGTRKE